MTRRDLLVVGGGATGLALADALSESDPELRITVLEQNTWGSGATGYAGAIDIPYAHTALHQELVTSGAARWKELAEDAAARGLLPPRLPLPFAWLVRTADAARHLGEALTTPVRPVGEIAGGAWRLPPGTRALAGEAHVIDPARLCALLVARLAARPRVTLLDDRRVTAVTIAPDGAGVTARTADGTAWEAGQCVLAMGPWLPEFLASHGPAAGSLGAAVRTKQVYGLRCALTDGASAVRYGVGSAEDGIFLFPRADDEYAMSVRHDVWDVPPREHEPPQAVLRRAGDFLDAVVGTGNWRITGAKVFADTYTADAVPKVERLDAAGAVLAVTGLHGSGVRLAPGMACHASRSVLHSRQEN